MTTLRYQGSLQHLVITVLAADILQNADKLCVFEQLNKNDIINSSLWKHIEVKKTDKYIEI